MCGIVGRLSARGPLPTGPFERMVDALAHRGPDGRGVRQPDPGTQLGHRRLAILDLSPEAGQPFVDPGGRHTLVFNGEIYNFKELRARLERVGRVFRTRSDTEVLLHALLEWGGTRSPS